MTQDQRDSLGRLITVTAMYFQRQVTKEVVSLMVDDLQDLPYEKVVKAYQTIRKDPKTQGFPLPAKIRAIVEPVPTPEAEGREAVERIKLAIAKFGWPQGAAAKEFIGPIGWRIVEGMGGWMRVCESDFIHNPGLLAQARNRAEDLVNYGDSFRDEVIQLPAPENFPALENKKFEALKAFKEHQAEKAKELPFDIPSDEERARMIQELLNKSKTMGDMK